MHNLAGGGDMMKALAKQAAVSAASVAGDQGINFMMMAVSKAKSDMKTLLSDPKTLEKISHDQLKALKDNVHEMNQLVQSLVKKGGGRTRKRKTRKHKGRRTSRTRRRR